jgi:hypothetical protein
MNRPFFFGVLMDQLLYIIISFFAGVVMTRLWHSLLRLGHNSIMMTRTINDCLLIMANNAQAAQESYEIKYAALELVESGDKYIDFQKKIDKQQLQTVQKTIIRNFINSVPSKYEHLIKFSDWDSAMSYLTDQLKRRNQS